jgi:O-antigen ligase
MIATLFMARGLVHSYSRGAWLATVCGGVYLIWQWIGWQLHERGASGKAPVPFISRFTSQWLPLLVVLLSVVVVLFWQFRQTEWHPAQRAISAVNPADFSWRNRVTAWEGDLQIMAERPWFGEGWNQPEQLYQHYYLPSRLTESAAITMNDHLLLGATLGVPALFCIGMYFWLSLSRKPASPSSILHSPSSMLLSATCRAGAIVLLVGFWFDGGLFSLPTAATFWILLELGAVRGARVE